MSNTAMFQPVDTGADHLHPEAQSYKASRHSATPAESGPCLESGALLRGRKIVEISHNGATYRLQATRLGKLILTK